MNVVVHRNKKMEAAINIVMYRIFHKIYRKYKKVKLIVRERYCDLM